MPSYRTTSILMASGCGALCLVLAFAPSVISWLFEIEARPIGDVLALRAAMLFLGLGLIAFLGRKERDTPLRRAVATGFVVVWVGLATTGLYEFARGMVGVGIWLAIIVEVALAAITLPHARAHGGL